VHATVARQEQDREDLLAEATALIERVEIAVPTAAEHVVIGFRRDGAASIYFGQDPAYHFNTRGELRRAYIDGRLLKADGGRLISLTRQRTDSEVQLQSHELTADEAAQVLDRLTCQLVELSQHLDEGRFRIVGQVPADVDVLSRGRSLLAELRASMRIAASPRVN
jgi:hypothetical protein